MATYCIDPINGLFKPVPEGAKIINLTKGYQTVVDPDVFIWAQHFKWYPGKYNGKVYASCSKVGRSIFLHRICNNTPDGVYTDHKNGVTLDNTRANLRNCTPAENMHNKPPLKGKKFKGVFKCTDRENRWMARFKVRGHDYYLGHFSSEIEAAKAYNEEAIKRMGEFAYLNVIPEQSS